MPPLSKITLTREDELELSSVAETVVMNTVNEYKEHLTVRNSVVDERRWKKIKHRDDMRVYRERSRSVDGGSSAGSSHGDPRSNHSNSYSSEADMDNTDDLTTAASMLAFGSIEGSLDDVMYGMISPSTKDMQIKTAYVEDGFADWALLAPLIKPSENDPFRELSVKLMVKRHPSFVGAVMRQRSVLYLETNGIVETPNGERIGYHVDHSIDVPRAREQPGVSTVRATVSFCFLFRQRRANCVEVFVRGIINPNGDAPASLIAITTAEIILSLGRNTHCAEMKKLTRILSSQSASVHALLSASMTASESSYSSAGAGGIYYTSANPAKSTDGHLACGQCSKHISGKFKLFRAMSKEKTCAMCSAHLCSSCRVYKTLYAPSMSTRKKLTESHRAFCTSCLACVVGTSSATFASLDARAARGEDVDYASALSMGMSKQSRMGKIYE